MKEFIKENQEYLFKNLSLSIFIIPYEPLLKRQEEWNKSVELFFKSPFVSLGHTAHLYFPKKQKDILEMNLQCISKSRELRNLKLIHKTSYSGLPYQISAENQFGDETIEVYFDGLIFFMTTGRKEKIKNLDEIAKITSYEGVFRNHCLKIVESYSLEVQSVYPPFWEAQIDNIKSLGIITEAEYPAVRILFEDRNFVSLTNLGDKQISTLGTKYSVYISEDKKSIRDRLCHDIVIDFDIKAFYCHLEENNRFVIDANSQLIDSLKEMPASFFTFFKRIKRWKKLKNIPVLILNIESILPKYNSFVSKIIKKSEIGTAFINVPRTMWIVGQPADAKEMQQREIENFFLLEYKDNKLNLVDSKPEIPRFAQRTTELSEILNELTNNTEKSIKNLNYAMTIYSTNYGFDAIWIAILALFVTISSSIPVKTILNQFIDFSDFLLINYFNECF